MTTLSGLKEATAANPATFSLIVSIPLSSLALMYLKSQLRFLTMSLARVVFPVPAGPYKIKF